MSRSDFRVTQVCTKSVNQVSFCRVNPSVGCVKYSPEKPGVSNLMSIYSCCTGKSFDEIENEFAGKGYGDFKLAVAEATAEELRPVREEYLRLLGDKAYLEACAKDGAERAARIAERTVRKAMKKVGFYQI